MFIAHLPAGYLLSKKIQEKYRSENYLWLGLFASILPDLDLFYFYLIDGRQTLHHSYWIHRPIYWFVILLFVQLMRLIFKDEKYALMQSLLFGNVFMHLVLDTFVGRIDWFYPFSEFSIALFEVPVVYDFWVFNFIFHWSFLFELAIVYFFAQKLYYSWKPKLEFRI